MTTSENQSGAGDFDFFIGSWRVEHRRLKERLVECTDWVEFSGTSVAQKILGGQGNFDDNTLQLPGGAYCAATIRTFNRETKQWSIWWIDGRNPGSLDVPVVGQFSNGAGLFFAEDALNGRAIKVRFMWTLSKPDRPRWEQAFSADAGDTWETNWVMEFSRNGTPP